MLIDFLSTFYEKSLTRNQIIDCFKQMLDLR